MIPYKNLYNYGTGRRSEENGQRHYINDSGIKIPSVTTVLSKTKDNTHLVKWRNRVGHDNAKQITKESADLGTMLHTHLEKFVKGEERPGGTNVGRILAKNMADTVITSGLCNVNEVWGIEVPLIYETLWAGTTDLVGLHNNEESIMDFKNTIRPKKEEWIEDYKLQLSAYALAHDHQYDTSIKKGVIFMVSRDLDYQEFIIEGEEFNRYKVEWCNRLEKYYTMIGI